MLRTYLGWTNHEHYLDDFIHVLASELDIEHCLSEDNRAYCLLADFLGVPREDAKDVHVHGTVVIVFGLKVDINSFTIQVPADKLARASQATTKALSQSSLTLKNI